MVAAILQSGSHRHIKNLVFNLGKFDWRKREQESNYNQFQDSLWKMLKPSRHFADPHILAIKAIAIYQPERAINFVETLIRRRVYLEHLSEIALNVAHIPEYLDRACESLWELGKEDSRALEQTTSHPIRLLSELCEFQPFRSNESISKVVNFALAHLDEPPSATGKYTAFDVLKGVFKTKVTRGVETNTGFYLEQYHVNPTIAETIRIRVVDRLILQLTEADDEQALRAVDVIREALRYPVSGADATIWIKHFETILQKVELAIAKKRPSPIVLNKLFQSVKFLSKASGDAAQTISRIEKHQPMDLDSRLLAAFLKGCNSHDRSSTEFLEKKANLTALFNELSTTISNTELASELLNSLLVKISAIPKRNMSNPRSVVGLFIENSESFAQAIVAWAQTNPATPLADCADLALAKLIEVNSVNAPSVVEAFFKSNAIELQKLIPRAFFIANEFNLKLSEENFNMIGSLLSSEVNDVASAALISIRVLSQRDLPNAVLLAQRLDCVLHANLVDPLMDIFSEKRLLEQLSPREFESLLAKLAASRDLDQDSIQTFLSFGSAIFPKQTFEFFKSRVERALASHEFSTNTVSLNDDYLVPMCFDKSIEMDSILSEAAAWLQSRNDHKFQKESRVTFYYLFKPLNDKVVSFLTRWAATGSADELTTISEIVSYASRSFIFEQTEFVELLLERASGFGAKTYEIVESFLLESATTGSRHGILGEPYKEDIENEKNATKMITSLPNFSPLLNLYNAVLEHSKYEIQKSHERARCLDIDSE